MTTNSVGTLTEAKLLAAFTEAGYVVSIPFGVARYDLIVELGGHLQKVQCKTGRLRNGVIIANAYSNPGGRGQYSYSSDDVDVLAIYCPDTDSCYLMLIDDVNGTKVSLRVDPCLNSQAHGVRWAKDHALVA